MSVPEDLKKNAPEISGKPDDQWDDLDSEKTILAIVEAIKAGGNTCEFFEGNIKLVHSLPKYKPDRF